MTGPGDVQPEAAQATGAASPHPADLALEALRVPAHGLGPELTFSSDLSVDETILLGETGYVPCQLVMGVSIHHIGWASSQGLASHFSITGGTSVFSNSGEGELVALALPCTDA